MAAMPPNPYLVEVRTYMVRMFSTLNEKGRRHYSAIEAIKLGHGGIGYVSELFGLDPDTVSQGIRELKQDDLLPGGPSAPPRRWSQAQSPSRRRGYAIEVSANRQRLPGGQSDE